MNKMETNASELATITSKEDSIEDKKDSVEVKKDSTKECDYSLVNVEAIKNILQEAGIFQCDREVITHLIDFTNFYAMSLIDQAVTFAKHAKKQTIDKSDVKVTLEKLDKGIPKRLPYQELIKLAREHNKSELPKIPPREGIAIPPQGTIIKESNYKLKSPYQYHFNYPLMDVANRQNQMITLNTIKHHQGGISTVLRPSMSHMPMPMNLTPQRIIFKPQISNPNVATAFQHKMDENLKKRIKLD